MDNLALFNGFINTNLFLKSKKKISGTFRKKRIIDKNKSENFFIETEFVTIDHCFIMLIEKIVSLYQNKFLS